jgi:hypothetical protein
MSCSQEVSSFLRWVHTWNVTAFRKVATKRSYDLNFHPVHDGVTVSYERYAMRFPVCYGRQMLHECKKKGDRSGRWWRVMLHVQTCCGRNRIIPLMRRPNTDNAPNMPVMLQRNQLLIRYVVMSSVHTFTIRCSVRHNISSVHPPYTLVTLPSTVTPYRDQWRTQKFFFGGGGGGATNSLEDRGQRERKSGGGSPIVRGSTQFAKEWNPYSY